MTEQGKTPQSYERITTYKDQQVKTVFDKRGRVLKVEAEKIGEKTSKRANWLK